MCREELMNREDRKAIDHINHVRQMAKVIEEYSYPKIMDNAIAKAAR